MANKFKKGQLLVVTKTHMIHSGCSGSNKLREKQIVRVHRNDIKGLYVENSRDYLPADPDNFRALNPKEKFYAKERWSSMKDTYVD